MKGRASKVKSKKPARKQLRRDEDKSSRSKFGDSDTEQGTEALYFNDDEFSRLNGLFNGTKKSKLSSQLGNNSDESEVEDLEAIAQSTRNAWGRDRVAFYGSDEDTDDDDDPEAMEEKLAEARRTHEAQIASLNLADFQSAMDFVSKQAEPDVQTTDDSKLAMESLLSHLGNIVNTLTSEPPEIMRSLSQKFSSLCTAANEESLRFLICRPTKIASTTVDFLDLQLRVALWGSILFMTADALGGFTSDLITEFQSLAKAIRKINKIRNSFQVQLARIRTLPLPKDPLEIQVEATSDCRPLDSKTPAPKSRLELAMELAQLRKSAVSASLARTKENILNPQIDLPSDINVASNDDHDDETGFDNLDDVDLDDDLDDIDLDDDHLDDDDEDSELGSLMDGEEKSDEEMAIEDHGGVVIDEDYEVDYKTQLRDKIARIPDFAKDVEVDRRISRKMMKNRGLNDKKAKATTRIASRRKAAKRAALNRKGRQLRAVGTSSGGYSGEKAIAMQVRRSRKLHQ